MATTTYEIGRSGRDCSIVCGSLDDLAAAAGDLPPGPYWVAAVRKDAGGARSSEDFAALHVRGPGDWTLTRLGPAGTGHACSR